MNNDVDRSVERSIDAATQHISDDRLVEICRHLVDTPSPTGYEAELAGWIAAALDEHAIEAELQPIDHLQANAWGRIPAAAAVDGTTGDGPTLLLYSPIDTATTGAPDDDLPWVGDTWRDDMVPHSQLHGDVIVGLGAMNPKGHAACVLMAAEAIAASGVPLRGDLVVAFGAGGMPTSESRPRADHSGNPTVDGRRNLGHGVGCGFLLERGVWADAAIIAKSGWSVASAEVGLAWCEVTVRGTHTYVGARHRLPYDNPITTAARLVEAIEAWAPEYSRRHTTGNGLVAPQLVVGNFEAGWRHTAAFVPAAARFTVDLRLAPGESPLDAKRELEAFVSTQVHSATAFDIDLVAAIPGTATDPRHWIVQATTEAWEAVTGANHQPPTGTSGATDANILRARGIPTARVGLPKLEIDGVEVDFALGMNAVSVPAMAQLTKLLVRAAVSTCSWPRVELEPELDLEAKVSRG